MIPKVHKLLYKAVIPPFLIALTVLTFVVFVREIGVLSELLITRNASLQVIAVIAGTILPGILIFSFPLSYLIGLLIGLSGLSGESQIIALRSCGVPLRRLLSPVLALGVIVGTVTGYFALILLPQANDILHGLKDQISLRQATNQIQPRVFNEEFPNVVFYLDDLAIDRQHWARVFLADNTNPKSPKIVLAREGSWVTDESSFRLQLHLVDGTVYEVNPEEPSKDNVSVFLTTDIPIDLHNGPASHPRENPAARPKKTFELTTPELWRGTPGASPEERTEQRIQLHRRIAIPFSVLGFSLLGLTLGISSKKGGRTSGFIISLVLVLLFYTLFMNGIRLASVGKLSPWLGAWGANILLTGIGLVLLATSERRHRLGRWTAGWGWTSRIGPVSRQLHLDAARSGIEALDDVIVSSTTRIARLRFPRVLDLYVGKGFLAYFLWSTVACVALFIILTLFDLLDDIIRNKSSVALVVDYFVFLLPQILLLVVPMAILLAILIHFGILERFSEVTALKAGGWSLYRISMPVFLIASTLCLSLYFMQDYVLPYANMRQDSLRNIIKGRPAQTTMRPQRKWIFGESNRIFNYEYFDAGQNVFVGLNVFEIDLAKQKVLRRIHASRATIGASGEWSLEGGWYRDFRPGEQAFEKIEQAVFQFPERPSYFQKEIFEPKESAKLTYLELKNYINYLRKSGYNATELQVALHKKVSFPLSCVVMALLGIPFSFSMGRKGAFFGITISIVIAIGYWGVFSVFEQLGAYGLLIPLLAAWAPNILFAAAGLFLLFTIRT